MKTFLTFKHTCTAQAKMWHTLGDSTSSVPSVYHHNYHKYRLTTDYHRNFSVSWSDSWLTDHRFNSQPFHCHVAMCSKLFTYLPHSCIIRYGLNSSDDLWLVGPGRKLTIAYCWVYWTLDIVLSPLLLHKSGIIYLLLSELQHHLTPSNVISKLTTLSHHRLTT